MRNIQLNLAIMWILILILTILFNYQIEKMEKLILKQNKIVKGQMVYINELNTDISKMLEKVDVITGKMIYEMTY